MKNNFLYIIMMFLILSSCKENRETIKDNELMNVHSIASFVEGYFLEKNTMPKTVEELRLWVIPEEKKFFDSLISTEIAGFPIKYVSVKKDLKKEIYDEYFIIASSKLETEILKDNEIEGFIEKSVSACEYNDGQVGNIILYYDSKYLQNYRASTFDVNMAVKAHWGERINFYIEIKADENMYIDQNSLNYEVMVLDSIIIKGNFYNEVIKQRAFNSKVPLKLKGLKRKINEGFIFLENTIIVPDNDDYAISKDFLDEKGNLKVPYYLKGCSKIK